MTDTVVITARIPGNLKRKLDDLGVNTSRLVRRSLEEEIRRLEMERLQARAEQAGEMLERIPPSEMAKSIRDGRESR